jgi:hypothetical protein
MAKHLFVFEPQILQASPSAHCNVKAFHTTASARAGLTANTKHGGR